MDIISKKEAKDKGLKRFFTGIPCNHNHLSVRFVSSGGCVDCSKMRASKRREHIAEYQKQYREQTTEKRLKYHKQHYQDNKEKRKQQSAEYRQNNVEYYSEYNKQYFIDNSEKLICRSREWYQENRKQILEDKKIYYDEHHQEFIARNAKRRCQKLNATPQWYEHEKVTDLYAKSVRLTEKLGIQHHVDHIVPLQSDVVCGLHCLANLQILSALENLRKGNSFEIE